MKICVLIFGLLLVGFLQGCTSYTYENISLPTTLLDQSRRVQISTPPNGRYDRTVYSQSGEMTAQEAKVAFSKYSSAVSIYADERPAADAYYVKPSILHWEERATEWSGIPDRITVQIQVYDAGSQIAGVQFSGKSKWFTFGGDHPQDLLEKPLRKITESFYEGTALTK